MEDVLTLMEMVLGAQQKPTPIQRNISKVIGDFAMIPVYVQLKDPHADSIAQLMNLVLDSSLLMNLRNVV